ncbi:MAG: copper chaperone PCu(A)C [Thiotrichales bacterium]|nr:copper chaperone PCu(A)C [Thiotrichales bacterium]
MKKTFTAMAFALLSAMGSHAALASQAEQIEIENPFAREVPPMAPASASFMQLNNLSDQAIDLVQAYSDAAQTVELHTHTNDGGVMRMRKIEKISIPANGMTELKPGGLHIMLISPTKPIKVGETVEVELEFVDGSRKLVAMPVKSFKGMKMGMTPATEQGSGHRCGSGMQP